MLLAPGKFADRRLVKTGFLEVGETAQIEEEWEAPDGALRVHLAAPYSGWITNGGGGRPVALMRGEKFFEAGGRQMLCLIKCLHRVLMVDVLCR